MSHPAVAPIPNYSLKEDGNGSATISGGANQHTIEVGAGSGDADRASQSPSRMLHDFLSLGEIQSALSLSYFSPLGDEGCPSTNVIPLKRKDSDGAGLGMRLPLLLRWLSVAQPLAILSPPLDREDGLPSSEKASPRSTLPVDPNTIVPLLEDLAAAHPDAENVEVLASALAPVICRDVVAKLPPLSRQKKMQDVFLHRQMMRIPDRTMDHFTVWNTKNLDVALQRLSNPTTTSAHNYIPPRKRQKEQQDRGDGKRQKVISNVDDPLPKKMMLMIDTSEQDDDDIGENVNNNSKKVKTQDEGTNNHRCSPFFSQPSSSAANNDSHESSMRRVLQDLIGLVKSSLRTGYDVNGGSGNDRVAEKLTPFFQATGLSTPCLSLKSDSLFSETDEVSSSMGGGWSRLSVMIPILMQHAPIMRHDHVAKALCRAAVPQAPTVIKCMAANACPAAMQSLLRGCVDAYRLAAKFESLVSLNDVAANTPPDEADPQTSSHANDILRTSVESTRCLASLSCREALTVIRILRAQGVMDGLVLSLSMEHDPNGAASFVVEKLSSSSHKLDGTDSMSHQLKPRYSLSLRQRMINSQSHCATHTSIERWSARVMEAVPSQLQRDLVQDKSLAENARRFISQHIIDLLNPTPSGETNISLGEVALFVRAYALLVYYIGIGAGSSPGSGSKFVEDTMTALGRLSNFNQAFGQELPTRSSKDHIHNLAICTAIVTCCKYPPIGDSDGPVMGGHVVKACMECVRGLLLCPSSVEASIFSSRLSAFIICNDSKGLRKVSLENIFLCHNANDDDVKEQILQMANVCRWLMSNLSEIGNLQSMQERGLSFNTIVHNPLVAIEALQRNTSLTASELDDLIENILTDPNICAKIIQHPRCCALIQESVKMLVRRPAPHIPTVLPLSLERLAQSIPWGEIGSETQEMARNKLLSQFVLQLFYALDFHDRQPLSAFAINPRLFPLRESLAFLDPYHEHNSTRKRSCFKTLHAALKGLVLKHCPDVLPAWDIFLPVNLEREWIAEHKFTVKPTMVCEAIRHCLRDNLLDPSGLRAEKKFVLCRSMYPRLEVDVTVVGAILASEKSHPKYYSYAALCKDPLLLLKARAAVWKRKGIRRILLQVLHDLMKANECITRQTSRTGPVASEYLAVRDTIIARCIVFACASKFVFGEHNTSQTLCTNHCMMSMSMIRYIVSKRRGIVAALIKQDIPDNCIDWIVKYVPESLLDAPIITSLLSENGFLTAMERLSAANSGLRIAVAHSLRGEAIAKMLLLASTTVLLDSFTMVIGPIGVPVSILREENGKDVTNLCREKMFRMIKTLSMISPRNTSMKNEASITLSKIATLCKSESAVVGISGVAATRRKALLKDIWETCLQATTALGGALQTS